MADKSSGDTEPNARSEADSTSLPQGHEDAPSAPGSKATELVGAATTPDQATTKEEKQLPEKFEKLLNPDHEIPPDLERRITIQPENYVDKNNRFQSLFEPDTLAAIAETFTDKSKDPIMFLLAEMKADMLLNTEDGHPRTYAPNKDLRNWVQQDKLDDLVRILEAHGLTLKQHDEAGDLYISIEQVPDNYLHSKIFRSTPSNFDNAIMPSGANEATHVGRLAAFGNTTFRLENLSSEIQEEIAENIKNTKNVDTTLNSVLGMKFRDTLKDYNLIEEGYDIKVHYRESTSYIWVEIVEAQDLPAVSALTIPSTSEPTGIEQTAFSQATRQLPDVVPNIPSSAPQSQPDTTEKTRRRNPLRRLIRKGAKPETAPPTEAAALAAQEASAAAEPEGPEIDEMDPDEALEAIQLVFTHLNEIQLTGVKDRADIIARDKRILDLKKPENINRLGFETIDFKQEAETPDEVALKAILARCIHGTASYPVINYVGTERVVYLRHTYQKETNTGGTQPNQNVTSEQSPEKVVAVLKEIRDYLHDDDIFRLQEVISELGQGESKEVEVGTAEDAATAIILARAVGLHVEYAHTHFGKGKTILTVARPIDPILRYDDVNALQRKSEEMEALAAEGVPGSLATKKTIDAEIQKLQERGQERPNPAMMVHITMQYNTALENAQEAQDHAARQEELDAREATEKRQALYSRKIKDIDPPENALETINQASEENFDVISDMLDEQLTKTILDDPNIARIKQENRIKGGESVDISVNELTPKEISQRIAVARLLHGIDSYPVVLDQGGGDKVYLRYVYQPMEIIAAEDADREALNKSLGDPQNPEQVKNILLDALLDDHEEEINELKAVEDELEKYPREKNRAMQVEAHSTKSARAYIVLARERGLYVSTIIYDNPNEIALFINYPEDPTATYDNLATLKNKQQNMQANAAARILGSSKALQRIDAGIRYLESGHQTLTPLLMRNISEAENALPKAEEIDETIAVAEPPTPITADLPPLNTETATEEIAEPQEPTPDKAPERQQRLINRVQRRRVNRMTKVTPTQIFRRTGIRLSPTANNADIQTAILNTLGGNIATENMENITVSVQPGEQNTFNIIITNEALTSPTELLKKGGRRLVQEAQRVGENLVERIFPDVLPQGPLISSIDQIRDEFNTSANRELKLNIQNFGELDFDDLGIDRNDPQALEQIRDLIAANYPVYNVEIVTPEPIYQPTPGRNVVEVQRPREIHITSYAEKARSPRGIIDPVTLEAAKRKARSPRGAN